MNLELNLSDPLCLANIRACAQACLCAYDPKSVVGSYSAFTDKDSGESVLFLDGDALVIAFPGTHDLRDMVRDLECKRIPRTILSQICSVHRGFDIAHEATAAETIGAAMHAGTKPVIVTGHSKGAAVAKRCALEIAQTLGRGPLAVITFGEPRGGDARYAKIYNSILGQRTIRITNAADPIPWVPGYALGNRPCGPEGYLRKLVVYKPEILYGLSAWTELAWNSDQIVSGWFKWWALKENPIAAFEELAEDDPLLDHKMENYISRLEAIPS